MSSFTANGAKMVTSTDWRFFDSIVAFHIPKEKVSFMITDQYEDTTIRVFARDPEKVPLIQRAFRK